MKSYRKEIAVHLPSHRGFVNITSTIEQCVRESGITEGLVLVNSLHVTSSVFVDDDEEGLFRHYEQWLEKVAPVLSVGNGLCHLTTHHMKRHVMGREVTVAITNGRLDFG